MDGDTKRVIDFAWMSKWLLDQPGKDDFEVALAETLARWSND